MNPIHHQIAEERRKAAEAERERIIALITTSDAPIWLCNLCRGEFAPMGAKRVREALKP